MGRRRRGLGIAGVLITLVLCFAVCSVLVGTSLLHLRVAGHSENEMLAQGLAEQAVALAVDQINKNPAYGTAGKPGFQQTLTAKPAWAGERMQGSLTFGSGQWFSTNNLNQANSVAGWSGSVVPAHCVQLVGVGTAGDCRRIVEVHYQNNPFPYAIGANSPLVSQGDLLVGALPEGTIATLQEAPADEELKPGHLRSNSAEQLAVQLSSRTLVTGNVESAGGIDLDRDARVLGASRPYSGKTRFPDLHSSKFDPGPNCPALNNRLSGDTVEGRFRVDGALTVDGDLNLEGGVIYVNGDVHVQGGIKGKGAVICSGKLIVDKASNFSNGQQVALISDGDLELHGQGTNRSYVQGLMYSNGSIKTSDITLMGSLIQGGTNQGKVDVSNSHLVHVPEYSHLKIDFKPPPPPPPTTLDVRYDNSKNSALLRMYNNNTVTDFVGFWPSGQLSSYYDQASDRYRVLPSAKQEMMVSFGTATYDASGQRTSWGQQSLQGAAARSAASDPRWATVLAQTGLSFDGLVDRVYDNLVQQVAHADDLYQAYKAYRAPTQSGSHEGGSFTFDLNEFLSPGDRLHLIRWHRV